MSSISSAVAVRESGPTAVVEQHRGDLAQVMPSHINAAAWTRLAIGALRRDPKLMDAARNDVGALMSALMDAAQKGLTPGTEEYYLTVRRVRKGGPKVIQGVTGYQGYIELMYRAGAVSSVIVEVVYSNDRFEYVPGRDARPLHEINWDADDRGHLRLAYAYAEMKDGATSKVVVLNRSKMAAIRRKSDGQHSEYSPWNTDEADMWLKSAARQLRKWVPTSAEYRKEQLRAAAEVAAEQQQVAPSVLPLPQPMLPDEDETVEGELVEEDGPVWPEPRLSEGAS